MNRVSGFQEMAGKYNTEHVVTYMSVLTAHESEGFDMETVVVPVSEQVYRMDLQHVFGTDNPEHFSAVLREIWPQLQKCTGFMDRLATYAAVERYTSFTEGPPDLRFALTLLFGWDSFHFIHRCIVAALSDPPIVPPDLLAEFDAHIETRKIAATKCNGRH